MGLQVCPGTAPDSEPVNEGVEKKMNAIIVTGGKQYKVAEGDVVKFEQVLAIIDGEEATFGTPVVEGACVEAKVVKNGKGKKIRIFKYNAKKGYRKRQGHRQPYTKVEIAKIVR